MYIKGNKRQFLTLDHTLICVQKCGYIIPLMLQPRGIILIYDKGYHERLLLLLKNNH